MWLSFHTSPCSSTSSTAALSSSPGVRDEESAESYHQWCLKNIDDKEDRIVTLSAVYSIFIKGIFENNQELHVIVVIAVVIVVVGSNAFYQ